MMKARLVPVSFPSGGDKEFTDQLDRLKYLLAQEAEILEPVPLGSPLPEAEAVVFPQLLVDAYSMIEALRTINLPFLIITSEFGTVSMWDWEIDTYMRSAGLTTIAPYTLELAKKACCSLGTKRELQNAKLMVYQDDPGEGMQASIFKRFYWWEDECAQRMRDKFGVTVVKKSFQKLGAEAKGIPDQEAERVWKEWQLPTEGVSRRALNSAIKVYIVLKREIERDPTIKAMGINCLNESRFSDTTPCLAWNMLYEELGIIWGCEADTMSMLTKFMLHRSLDVPIMMTNVYPFLMGMAALKHERIPGFPETPDPEDHLLLAHCGYFGVVPQSFCTDWTLRPKVLAIVDDNATAIDARMPTGDITLAKLHPSMQKMMVVEGTLENYVQYSKSDCLNGAVVRVPSGHKFMNQLYSHHNLLLTGHKAVEIETMAKAFGLGIETL